jgi:hypothetical protein
VAASAAGNAIHVIGGVIVLAVHVAFPDVGIFGPFVPWMRQSSGPGGEGRSKSALDFWRMVHLSGRIFLTMRCEMTMKALVDEMSMADGLKEVRAALNAILAEAQRLEDENGVLKAQIEELEKAHSLA